VKGFGTSESLGIVRCTGEKFWSGERGIRPGREKKWKGRGSHDTQWPWKEKKADSNLCNKLKGRERTPKRCRWRGEGKGKKKATENVGGHGRLAHHRGPRVGGAKRRSTSHRGKRGPKEEGGGGKKGIHRIPSKATSVSTPRQQKGIFLHFLAHGGKRGAIPVRQGRKGVGSLNEKGGRHSLISPCHMKPSPGKRENETQQDDITPYNARKGGKSGSNFIVFEGKEGRSPRPSSATLRAKEATLFYSE